jgi:hypothetical protein
MGRFFLLTALATGLQAKLHAALEAYAGDASDSNYRGVQVSAMIRAIQFNRRRGQVLVNTVQYRYLPTIFRICTRF